MKERKHGLGLKSRRTPQNFDSGREGGTRTHGQQFIRLPLWPTELLPKEKGFIRTTPKTGLLISRHLTVAIVT